MIKDEDSPTTSSIMGNIVTSTGSVPKTPKTRRGRRVGYRKPQPLSNGQITVERIFDFIDRETIPVKDLPKFLKICDTWINDLGADSLKDTDIEEIGLYARERVYIDGIYRGFAEADTIDPNLITQIEKMNKGLEARKENLGARFKDRGQARKNKDGMSFLSLFENFEENSADLLKQAIEKKLDINNNKEDFTDVDSYMEAHVSTVPDDKPEGSE